MPDKAWIEFMPDLAYTDGRSPPAAG